MNLEARFTKPSDETGLDLGAETGFDAFCEELRELATRTLNLDLPPEARRSIVEVEANAEAQHFRIVLVSPFQGGKSTIFNTICGGRELSPTGFGIKTSAVIAEARYLEDPQEQEFAELDWRSDEELQRSVEEIVALRFSQSGSFPGRTQKEWPSLCISEEKDRRWLLKAIMGVGAKDPGSSELGGVDEELKVAYLTVKHYEASAKLRLEERPPLSRVTSWLAFPEAWNQRLLDEFKAEEVAFLFLKKAIFYLREPALRKLRASIIDAPGLQASTWDTAVTTDSIRYAHAVICLLGTQSRSLSQAELKEFESFRRFELSESVFYGYNARERGLHVVRERLLPEDLHRLQQVGLEIPENRISIFNALLAYRSRQFQMLQEDRLPKETVSALSVKARETLGSAALPENGKNPLENARHLVVGEMEIAYKTFVGQTMSDLSPEAVSKAEMASQWQDLIARTSRFVIARKAEAILVDRGSRQVLKALDRLDGDLQDREMASERNAETVMREKEEAEAALQDFEADVTLVQQRVEEDLESIGHKALWDELVSRFEDTSALEAEMSRVIEVTTSPRFLASSLAGEAVDFVEQISAGWQAGLTNGTSRALKKVVREVLKPVEKRLGELARAAEARAPGLLHGGVVVLVPEAVHVPSENIGEVVAAMFQKSGATRLADDVEDAAAKIGLGEAVDWARSIFNLKVIDARSSWRLQLKTAIPVVKGVASNLGKELVAKQIKGMQKEMRKEIDNAAQEVRNAYKDRLTQREQDLAKSSEEREKIASEAREKRVEVREVRQRAEEFTERVRAQFRPQH